MKSEKMAVLLLVLLLCAGSSIAQDLLSPTVDIIAELEKLKHMDERIQKLEGTLTKVSSENEALKNKLESLQKENEGKKVAFSAGLLASGTGNVGLIDDTKTIEYKKVFSNVGNAYDSNTGIFTAPVKGVYYFRFYGHCQGGTTMAITLMKNGQTQCSVHSARPASNSNASNGVVLTLEIGDKIYTRLWKNTWVYDDPASYTSFSGFLIFPL